VRGNSALVTPSTFPSGILFPDSIYYQRHLCSRKALVLSIVSNIEPSSYQLKKKGCFEMFIMEGKWKGKMPRALPHF